MCKVRRVFLLAASLSVGITAATSCSSEDPTFADSSHRGQPIGTSETASGPPDIIVNSTSDVADLGWGADVSNLPGPDGLVSLREAIIAAENSSGPQVIAFNIPTSDQGFYGGVFTIMPQSALPTLTDDGTTIDGATQTLYSNDPNPLGPEIVLDGSEAGDQTGGLSLNHSRNGVIRGLVIHSFSTNGIGLHFADAYRIVGCYIGTDETGTEPRGNGHHGISGEGSNNIIGGPDPSDRNVVSGNIALSQVGIDGANNVIEGNFIGTDRTGTLALGNDAGITIGESGVAPVGNLIKGNLISGNHTAILLSAASITGTRIEGNLIGTDITGGNPLPNRADAISLGDGAHDNLVEGNRIAFNEGSGVVVGPDATGNRITGNWIHSNDGLGIDLGPDGVTANDPGDIDTGPNDLMNFPVLAYALANPGRLVVGGTIDTPNPERVTIEFFANPVPTPGGDLTNHGEGAVYLGGLKPNPLGMFTAALPPMPPGTLISATATDADGNTSEFSENIEAQRAGRR